MPRRGDLLQPGANEAAHREAECRPGLMCFIGFLPAA